ncbi:MAG: FkbM family methyltransferase [Pseudomonadota bacterium]
MPQHDPLPLYYPGKTLADMEAMLRVQYLRSSGWLESAEHKLARRDGKPLPWFTYAAIAFLERNLPPDLAMFEYGGGQSTLYWAERLRRVVSIDHDPAFAQHLQGRLPEHAELKIIAEGQNGPLAVPGLLDQMPQLSDPERTTRTYRSGQLNHAFRDYALQILDYPADSFDVVVVDGMARILSTWAAIQHFRRGGFIIFDNADRDEYRPAYDMLEEAGYRRLDFWGLGPINPYEWCTSVFYHAQRFTQSRWFDALSPAKQPAPSDGMGILVTGYNRPHHLQAVLESLRLQGRIGDVHVWIDGTQGRGEYLHCTDHCLTTARRYKVREVRAHHGHLGIEKMMLDALSHMTALYDKVLVLEDDCFPLAGSVAMFETELEAATDDAKVFSIYGHPFGTEPADTRDFPRFQGWGWAAHSHQIRALLPELRRLFAMDENRYVAHVAARLTDKVRARLDVTPGRDVLKVLSRGFSWDSALAMLSAEAGLAHRSTPARAIVNTGISPGIGHFREDVPRLRAAPFNMISIEEAWQHYDTQTKPCDFSRASYGLDQLDQLILKALPAGLTGTFVEIGGYDGVTQSNSVLLEKQGWTGLLIEANPGSYAKCCRTRPAMRVEHAACVAADFARDHTTITDVGLMSMTDESRFTPETRADWLERGAGFAGREPQDIEVPALPISTVLDKQGLTQVDLLLLDVEGAEIDVLGGLDFSRHAPAWIVAEDAYDADLNEVLVGYGYERVEILLERKFTRDCLYRQIRTSGSAR